MTPSVKVILYVALIGVILSLLEGLACVMWYGYRKARWPGVVTAKLPNWAQNVQAFVEMMRNVPGFLMAWAGTGGKPPGSLIPTNPDDPPAPTPPQP